MLLAHEPASSAARGIILVAQAARGMRVRRQMVRITSKGTSVADGQHTAPSRPFPLHRRALSQLPAGSIALFILGDETKMTNDIQGRNSISIGQTLHP
jgi:hypothetical protein